VGLGVAGGGVRGRRLRSSSCREPEVLRVQMLEVEEGKEGGSSGSSSDRVEDVAPDTVSDTVSCET
jgi:hypothetical protein